MANNINRIKVFIKYFSNSVRPDNIKYKSVKVDRKTGEIVEKR